MQIEDKWKDGYSFGATQTFNYWEDSNIKYTAVNHFVNYMCLKTHV